ncbi:AraC family transcriptional regulator [Anaerocolumna cellulosilytica]|uniref:AraC family transcriptional regulator n=1 Tax=Anaerocolumna cellulosilytica TaxID=433286 RepID=A0A6S6QUN4_9FIRM|nr:AraC family transcriptional regulator [Anaerocolumna cellulosilytica]MBB5194694.1 AraC-like DNA-binding protein [Anaerocolumna cellulosilytica]BCJ94344.1 AraC family transcriptional regulator [Anaerocolumna cellulosilytica]
MNCIVFEEEMEGITIDRIVRDYEFTMPIRHFHNEFEVYYLLKGERYYFIGNRTYLVKQGSLVFVDTNQIHKTGLAGASYHDRILIMMNKYQMLPIAKLAGISLTQFFSENYGVVELKEVEQKNVESLLFQVMDEIKEKAEGYEFIVRAKLIELIMNALRYKNQEQIVDKGTTAQTAKHRKVHEVVDYINQNYTSNQSLMELAERFYVSKYYLSRIFKEVTGFTVMEYIHVLRIREGKKLLTDSDYKVTEIAERLGFESITYFEKVFKKYSEVSPIKYRKQKDKRKS